MTDDDVKRIAAAVEAKLKDEFGALWTATHEKVGGVYVEATDQVRDEQRAFRADVERRLASIEAKLDSLTGD